MTALWSSGVICLQLVIKNGTRYGGIVNDMIDAGGCCWLVVSMISGRAEISQLHDDHGQPDYVSAATARLVSLRYPSIQL